jgi:hypothetical protein
MQRGPYIVIKIKSFTDMSRRGRTEDTPLWVKCEWPYMSWIYWYDKLRSRPLSVNRIVRSIPFSLLTLSYSSQDRPWANLTSCTQLGLAPKGPRAGVIYSRLLKVHIMFNTLQVLQRTALGPAPPKADPESCNRHTQWMVHRVTRTWSVMGFP